MAVLLANGQIKAGEGGHYYLAIMLASARSKGLGMVTINIWQFCSQVARSKRL
jgi:hypothetical protein